MTDRRRERDGEHGAPGEGEPSRAARRGAPRTAVRRRSPEESAPGVPVATEKGAADTEPPHLNVFQYVSTYRILEEIARGGMGRVYLAEQLGVSGFSKTVGIKTIRREFVNDGEFRDRFIGEARLVADLVHENIQQVYQLVDMAGSYAIVMEWISGATLEEVNTRLDERDEHLPPDLAIFIASRVARALAYAHGKRARDGTPLNLVHRDVSPVNIFASWQGVVKLADFGIAKGIAPGSVEDDQRIIGKTPYLAPEQVRGAEVDQRCDLFALGLMLFELLTGEQLYPVETFEELRELHRDKPLPAPRLWNPDVPSNVEPILHRLLDHDPERRYQRAQDVVRDLELFMYSGGYGPTNERLGEYLDEIFPEIDKERLI